MAMKKATTMVETITLGTDIGPRERSTAYEALKEIGIPVKVAMFKVPVKFKNQAPESAFYDPSEKAKSHKTAVMHYTPHGLTCEQTISKIPHSMIIPLENVVYTLPL